MSGAAPVTPRLPRICYNLLRRHQAIGSQPGDAGTGFWNLLRLSRYSGKRRRGSQRRPKMSVPVFAVATMVVLTLIARERDYRLTSSSLLFLTGALTAWFVAGYWW